MDIYEYVTPPSAFGAIDLDNLGDAYDEILDGYYSVQPMNAAWEAPQFRLESRPSGVLPDFSAMVVVPIISEAAWKVVSPLCGDDVEPLPATLEGHPYVVLNVLKVVRCLDMNASEFMGPIVTRYAFAPGFAMDAHLFRIHPLERLRPFMSGEFRSAIERAGLTGIRFGSLPGQGGHILPWMRT